MRLALVVLLIVAAVALVSYLVGEAFDRSPVTVEILG